MAGGLHIFGGPTSRTGMFVLNVEHDKEYDLTQIAERFEVDYQELNTPVQAAAYNHYVTYTATEVAKYAINTYTRLRHWKFYDKRPVELDQSDAQYDLDLFRSSSQKLFNAVNNGSLIDTKGKVAYVVKLWFVTPKIRVEVITPEKQDDDVTDGLVNPYNITDFVPLEVPKESK